MNIDLQEELSKGAEYLFNAGIGHPRLEAELLLSKVLNISREKLYLKNEVEIRKEDYKKFRSALSEREKKIPIAYLLKNKEFMSLDFFVDKRVLIPRPETELIVEKVLSIIDNHEIKYFEGLHNKKDFTWRIIDLGTGSGNLAISMAYYLPNSQVWAVDISDDALQVAKKNAEKNEVENRVNFLQGDWFVSLKGKHLEGKIDFIVSNPPYLTEEEMNSLAKDVEYEPNIALDGGKDGLKFHREIIEGSGRYLKAGGYLILEMGIRHKEKIFKLIKEIGGYGVPEVIKDYSGFKRIVVVKYVRQTKKALTKLTITRIMV